jgi:hypothetical protein
VGVDCFIGDSELLGNLLIGLALPEQHNNLRFPLGDTKVLDEPLRKPSLFGIDVGRNVKVLLKEIQAGTDRTRK